jgi:hypothetical protein
VLAARTRQTRAAVIDKREHHRLCVGRQLVDARIHVQRAAGELRHSAAIEHRLRDIERHLDVRQIAGELFRPHTGDALRGEQSVDRCVAQLSAPILVDLFRARHADVVADADRHAALAARPARPPQLLLVEDGRGDFERDEQIEARARDFERAGDVRNLASRKNARFQRGHGFRAEDAVGREAHRLLQAREPSIDGFGDADRHVTSWPRRVK